MNEAQFWEQYGTQLNEVQREAVRTTEGALLLLAVPGSGKTTVLVTRLGYMLLCKNISAEEILTLTYTVAATADMKRRFQKLFGKDYAEPLEFRTINGICAKIIGQYSKMIGKPAFQLVTEEKQTGSMLSGILTQVLPDYPTESDVKNARTLITYCKNMLFEETEIKALGEKQSFPLLEVYQAYNDYLRKNRLMDYDDQMVYAYRLLVRSEELTQFYRKQYRYVCVDEAQDTSKIQHLIIQRITGRDGNLFMVGDEDQSIYGFRAAYPEALLNFKEEHKNARLLVMSRNYRSGEAIVSAADRFIRRNKARYEKQMEYVRKDPASVSFVLLNNRSNQYNYLVKAAEGCLQNQRETAVLYRDNESVLPLADLLDRKGVPFCIRSSDMTFFSHRVVADIVNIFRFASNPHDTELFMRIYYKCQTFLKKAQAEELCRISSKTGKPILDGIDHIRGLSGMAKGKCRAFATHLTSMTSETPGKALFRIEKPLGYREYLERNGLDPNKLFILKMLAFQETSLSGFLSRLDELKETLSGKKRGEKGLILSTIHSAKGLEYDRVFLMDVCDGIFPAVVLKGSYPADSPEVKTFEEERRLLYVGMTRAKNELTIFQYKDTDSCFMKELAAPEKKSSLQRLTHGRISQSGGRAGSYDIAENSLPDGFELIIGERVIQRVLGAGTVSDVIYDSDGHATVFTVTYDSGKEKQYMYPLAFHKGMGLLYTRERN